MPTSWKETINGALIIVFVSILLSLALYQTQNSNIAETLRTSGFVDGPLPSEVEINQTDAAELAEETSSLAGMIGLTIRQLLQIGIPFLITLRILKRVRQASRRRKAVAT